MTSSQVINTLEDRYGSHRAAHAAGWRWNARPNHDQSSHLHAWWPPQAVVSEHGLDSELPLGTRAAWDFLQKV